MGCSQPLRHMERIIALQTAALRCLTTAEGPSCAVWGGYGQLGNGQWKDESDSQRAPCSYTVSAAIKERFIRVTSKMANCSGHTDLLWSWLGTPGT